MTDNTPDVNDIRWTIDRLPARDRPDDGGEAYWSQPLELGQRQSLVGDQRGFWPKFDKPERMSDEELQERIDNVAGVVPGVARPGKGLF